MTPGIKTSEVWITLAGLLAALIPVVLDKVPPESIWAVLLGGLLAACTYIAGRSWLKVTTAKADAVVMAATAASKGPTGNP